MTQQQSFIPQRKRGKVYPPFEELSKLYFGEPKTGKTSLASQDPNGFFVATEPGHDFVETGVVNVRRWAPDASGADRRPDFKTLVQQLWDAKAAGQLPYKTAYIDIIDNLYDMCLFHECQEKRGIDYPPENDYGKTWSAIKNEFSDEIRKLMEVVNVNFITHCASEKIEVKDPKGMVKEVNRLMRSFRGKKAQFLDGIINCMGYTYRDAFGNFVVTFQGANTLDTGDRTNILQSLGPIALPPEQGYQTLCNLYAQRAQEMGITIQSKHAQ